MAGGDGKEPAPQERPDRGAADKAKGDAGGAAAAARAAPTAASPGGGGLASSSSPMALVATSGGGDGGADDDEGGAKGKKKGSITHEERYSRPVPSAEVVAAADFTVKAIKFCNEHTGVKWTQLRPLWVWKRKGGNAMNKIGGAKRKSVGGDGEGKGEEEEETPPPPPPPVVVVVRAAAPRAAAPRRHARGRHDGGRVGPLARARGAD